MTNEAARQVQHYVPQFLLRNFSSGKKPRLWVFDKSNEHLFQAHVRHVAAERRFYDLTVGQTLVSLEGALAALEAQASSGKRGQIYFLTGKRGQIYFLSAIGDTYVTVSVKERETMPRKARIVIPGVAHHVVQRGHNRQVLFAALKGELDVRLYAYFLMTNHVHLLLMPAQGKL